MNIETIHNALINAGYAFSEKEQQYYSIEKINDSDRVMIAIINTSSSGLYVHIVCSSIVNGTPITHSVNIAATNEYEMYEKIKSFTEILAKTAYYAEQI